MGAAAAAAAAAAPLHRQRHHRHHNPSPTTTTNSILLTIILFILLSFSSSSSAIRLVVHHHHHHHHQPSPHNYIHYNYDDKDDLLLSQGRTTRRLIGPGSSPPTCRSKCGTCTPCKPVHVPIQQGMSVPLEYYPEAWRCKCGNKLYMP